MSTTAKAWFFRRDLQNKLGPYSPAELREMAGRGELRPTDKVWKEGLPRWVEARVLKGLFDKTKAAEKDQSRKTGTVGADHPKTTPVAANGKDKTAHSIVQPSKTPEVPISPTVVPGAQGTTAQSVAPAVAAVPAVPTSQSVGTSPPLAITQPRSDDPMIGPSAPVIPVILLMVGVPLLVLSLLFGGFALYNSGNGTGSQPGLIQPTRTPSSEPKSAGQAIAEVERLHAEDHYSLGYALMVRGKMDEAVAEYREALRLRPDFAEAHCGIGSVLNNKGEVDEANVEYREALRLRPDLPEVHFGLGYALQFRGKVDEAILKYREALRLRPDFAEAHYNLSSALQARGKVDEAILEYREALRSKPDLAERLGHSPAGQTTQQYDPQAVGAESKFAATKEDPQKARADALAELKRRQESAKQEFQEKQDGLASRLVAVEKEIVTLGKETNAARGIRAFRDPTVPDPKHRALMRKKTERTSILVEQQLAVTLNASAVWRLEQEQRRILVKYPEAGDPQFSEINGELLTAKEQEDRRLAQEASRKAQEARAGHDSPEEPATAYINTLVSAGLLKTAEYTRTAAEMFPPEMSMAPQAVRDYRTVHFHAQYVSTGGIQNEREVYVVVYQVPDGRWFVSSLWKQVHGLGYGR